MQILGLQILILIAVALQMRPNLVDNEAEEINPTWPPLSKGRDKFALKNSVIRANHTALQQLKNVNAQK